jgi:hypothetical protein
MPPSLVLVLVRLLKHTYSHSHSHQRLLLLRRGLLYVVGASSFFLMLFLWSRSAQPSESDRSAVQPTGGSFVRVGCDARDWIWLGSKIVCHVRQRHAGRPDGVTCPHFICESNRRARSFPSVSSSFWKQPTMEVGSSPARPPRRRRRRRRTCLISPWDVDRKRGQRG